MKPVRQSRSGPNADCTRAAIASILELKLENVPDFALMEDDGKGKYEIWYLELQAFLKKFGFCMIEMALTEHTPLFPMPWPPLVLMFGMTASNVKHCIVGMIEDLSLVPVWNPDPLAKITGVMSLGLLVPLNPAAMELRQNNKIISLS